MLKFSEWLKATSGEEMPKGEIKGEWFFQRGLPMVVACSCCSSTMVLPSAYIDEDCQCYCRDCAGVEEGDEE